MIFSCRVAATCLVVLIAAFDIRHRRIPDILTLGLAVVALANSVVAVTLPGLWEATAVFLGGLVLFSLGAMGGGDVKMLAAGALLLPGRLPDFCFVTAVAGGVLALAVLCSGRKAEGRFGTVPYGVAIGAGIVVCVWL